MLVGRLLDKDNDDDTDHGKLVTTLLNHRNDNFPSLPFPSLPFPKHYHFPSPHPRYTQLIHPRPSPDLGMRISAHSRIP
jgi:hypothetical protein